MSSYAPPHQNGPTQRHPDLWQSTRYVPSDGNSIKDRVNGYFGGDRHDLPLYKDKPTYKSGRRAGAPWYKQRRTVAVALTGLALLSWWFGILSPLSFFTRSGSGDTVAQLSNSKSRSGSSWFGGTSGAKDWESRREKVKEVFKISFDGYEKHAFGYDEFHPRSKDKRQMTPQGMGWIIVDALDTMMLMNLTTELAHARQWVHHNLTYDQDHDVNTFETTIRMLGGLLSAHYLSTEFPGVYAPVDDDISDDMYIEKATDLADRLLSAYESQSGVPFASVNLHKMQGIASHDDGGASSTAEATSLQLEMKYLAKLTGEDNYWDKTEHVMKVIDDNHAEDGLVPIFVYADSGKFRGSNIRLGSRGDSFYEYLAKQYEQTSHQEPVYQAMWNETLAGIKKHLITYSHPNNFTVLAERPNGLNGNISPKMDHLVCFMPGTIALAATGGLSLAQARAQPKWGPEQEENIRLAEELMNTCWGMYLTAPTGLAGEITHFKLHDPPLMYDSFAQTDKPTPPAKFDTTGTGSDFVGHDDFIIKAGDAHNLQRPETVESLFYMWRITGDEKYRQWGWQMFESFVKWTAVDDGTGFSSVSNVLQTPPPTRDNMESFWLAETLKYFYLLFGPNDVLPLNDIVFNTEAHPFPRFQLGKLFSTGWQRKPRDESGNLLPEPAKNQDGAVTVQTTAFITQVVAKDAAATPAVPQSEGTGAMDPVTGKEKEV